MKKTLKILALLCLILAINGCMKESLTDKMMNYINNKYDDEFTYVGPYGGSPGSNQKKITVSSKKIPDKAIHVICSDIDGEQEMTDNYLGIKFEEQTYNEIEKRLKSVFNQEIYLNYTASGLACIDNASDETTFEEYISDPAAVILFQAFVKVESDYNKSELENKIKNVFSDMSVGGYINLVGDDFDFNNHDKYYRKKYLLNNLNYDTYNFQFDAQSKIIDAYWENEK